MSAKLFIAALIAIACIVVSEATVAIITYGDSNCNAPIGYYGGTAECQTPVKRMVEGGTPTCQFLSEQGPFFRVYECNTDTTAPNTAIPDSFQSIKTTFNSDCDYSGGFDIAATAFNNPTLLVIYASIFGNIPSNVTIICNNGDMSFTSCIDGFGCVVYESVMNGVCTSANSTIEGSPLPSGIQTSCVYVPQAPVTPPMAPPMAEPMTVTPVAPVAAPVAPVAAPKAATPVKKSSDAVSVVVGSVVALVSAATLIL